MSTHETLSRRTLYNDPETYVNEALAGMVLCYPSYYALSEIDSRVVQSVSGCADRKVGVISLGGFGHLPVFAGYVGSGLLDACAVGNIFASPSAIQIANAARIADRGNGVVAIVGNYGGDVMNTKLASAMLKNEGIALHPVYVTDDIASAAFDERERRRGVAGIVLAIKIAGAAADRGDDAVKVTSLASKALSSCHSFGVALASCIVPTSGRATFEISETELDFGMGIHGEPGIKRGARMPANDVVDFILDRLLEDRDEQLGSDVALLLNSLGATPLEELFIMGNHAFNRLKAEKLKVRWSEAGRFATSMEMAGASLTLMTVDDEIVSLLEAPASCPFWKM